MTCTRATCLFNETPTGAGTTFSCCSIVNVTGEYISKVQKVKTVTGFAVDFGFQRKGREVAQDSHRG